MAGVEDFGDFESSFLDSMLEVEMTEEDGEVKISQTDYPSPSNERELPPIPRFDLQSETLSYKDVYSNSVLPAKQTTVLRPVPAQMPSTSIGVPVIQPAPMIVIHSNMLKSNNVALKPSNVGNTVPTVVAKPSPMLKAILTKTGKPQDLAHKFTQEVFHVDFVKKVYTQKENLPDVSIVGAEEEAFYKSAFEDVSKVQLCRLHCTICDKHIGCGKGVEKKICVHNMLKVLTCKVCYEFYGDGNFPCDDGDHCEIYCRWCGQGGALICCSFCPKVFCKRCVRRNYTQSYLRAVEKASDWACFVCAQKPLWPHRAVCRALVEYMKHKKANLKSPVKDTSICCKSNLVNKKIISEVERNKIFLSGGQTFQLNSNGTSASEGKNKVCTQIGKPVSGNGNLVVKNFSTALKVNSQTKAPVGVINKPNVIAISPKIASSSLYKNNISQPVPNLTSVSGVNIPHIINTPIYHGQTLITPPSAKHNSPQKNVQNKDLPLNVRNKDSSLAPIKVSVADCVNVDIKKIPVAKIPPYVQGVILRLNFPDNKVQLVRLVREGVTEESSNFPIPIFENSENLDFLEGSLEDSFKLTKMLFERLMKIKEKLNSKTKHTKESVYKSSVKKLSFIYEKSRELMKELDDNLLANYELWKGERDQDNEISVIDLSDDEGTLPGKQGQSTSIFAEKSKIFAQDDDSDIEVLPAGKDRTNKPRRILRSNTKRISISSPEFGRRLPSSVEHIDLNTYSKKKKSVGRPRKKPKLCEDEEVMEIMEKDPLAVSDTEPEFNGLESCVTRPLKSEISVKEKNLYVI